MSSKLHLALSFLNLFVGVVTLLRIEHANTVIEHANTVIEHANTVQKSGADAIRRKNERVALIEEHLVYHDMK
jgi:hypothetical protein